MLFRSLIFIHKSNWVDIIPELKIYFGDDFIFHDQLYNNRRNMMIYNVWQYSPMAATSGDKTITGGAYEREHPYYVDWASQHPIPESAFNQIDINEQYVLAKKIPSDINEHVEILRSYANKCQSVTEFGVRTGISTRAFVASNVPKIRCYDLYIDPTVSLLVKQAEKEGKDILYSANDTRALDIEQTDLLFIDTEHSYAQLKAELTRHHSKVNKYIEIGRAHV